MYKANRKIISYLMLFAAVPIVTVLGTVIFKDKQYAWITVCLALLSCIPFFLSFENGNASAPKMVVISVMISIAVSSRIIFYALPSFKPVTAIVIITAIYFGGEAGFLTGALTALVSNFYFGQGPWTPFQMFAWGFAGLIAGLLSKQLKNSRILLIIYGLLSGVTFSLIMDVWTVLSLDGVFNIRRYLLALASSFVLTCIYSVSNAVFLILINKPSKQIFKRIKTKYRM